MNDGAFARAADDVPSDVELVEVALVPPPNAACSPVTPASAVFQTAMATGSPAW